MELKTLLTSVTEIVYEVGSFIREENRDFESDHIEYKGFNDLVSYVDKTAESKLVDGLRELLPEAGFITEEGSAEDRKEEYRWVIDPLDGTTNFIHKLPVFAVSVALLRDEKPVLGIVYEINRDECFTAIAGEGAYMNGEPIRLSSVRNLSESLLATGFPYYNFKQLEDYLKILKTFMESTHGLRRMGSAAVDLVYVACGRFDGFFEYNLNAWDVAAGVLIVKEAGGSVTDFSGGNNYLFGREVIAAGAVHGEMLDTIRTIWPA